VSNLAMCHLCEFQFLSTSAEPCKYCISQEGNIMFQQRKIVTTTEPNTGFTKHDSDKLRYDLVPVKPLERIVEILTLGAKKYSDNNWVKCPSLMRYYAAAQRHLNAWASGEDLDVESNKTHLAHAACCLMFMMEIQDINANADDRYKRKFKTHDGLTDADLNAMEKEHLDKSKKCSKLDNVKWYAYHFLNNDVDGNIVGVIEVSDTRTEMVNTILDHYDEDVCCESGLHLNRTYGQKISIDLD